MSTGGMLKEDDSMIEKYDNVKYINNFNSQIKIHGDLFLSPTHLIFYSKQTKSEIRIFYSWIGTIDKLALSIDGSPLVLRCKQFLNCTIYLQKESDCLKLISTLNKLSKPSTYNELSCFKANENLKVLRLNSLSSKLSQLEGEFARMGLPNKEWTLASINTKYETCDTYPSILYAPSSASESLLLGSANFRSRNRLPALSYLHPNGASICRCSQPLTGFSGRCLEDEKLLDCILKTNQNSNFMYLVDTRPKINALANKAQGKGFENENNYSNIQFYFFSIENIHVMRSSLQKLIETFETQNLSMSTYMNCIERSDWLRHIKVILETAKFIMEALNDQGVNVLVHCSDGWDRTAQTCALSSLLLDPYYRTIHGYQVLIEKEWLAFGHKFSDRCGFLDHDAKEISPIFTQFLDCTWQLMKQFPCAFEFNEDFLLEINDHLYSCQYGTFIGNCEKERVELEINTYSLWDHIQYNLKKFLNPLYKPNSMYSKTALRPDTRLQSLRLWKGLYNRFDENVNLGENSYDAFSIMHDRVSSYEQYNLLLEKSCDEIKSKMQRNDSIEKDELHYELSDKFLETKLAHLKIDWISFRDSPSCNCFTTSTNKKKNCFKCGKIYCLNCILNVNFQSDSDNNYNNQTYCICKSCLKTHNCTDSLKSVEIIERENLSSKFSINNSD